MARQSSDLAPPLQLLPRDELPVATRGPFWKMRLVRVPVRLLDLAAGVRERAFQRGELVRGVPGEVEQAELVVRPHAIIVGADAVDPEVEGDGVRVVLGDVIAVRVVVDVPMAATDGEGVRGDAIAAGECRGPRVDIYAEHLEASHRAVARQLANTGGAQQLAAPPPT
jgi:hypothetical protein